jgi:hypothetical protein
LDEKIMLIKVLIVILLIGLVISLASGLVFLFKDVGTTRRTLNSLGIRIALAIALMGTTLYGFFSGQLEVGAPWDARKYAAPQQQMVEPQISNDINEEE